jgi:hypothetical protein
VPVRAAGRLRATIFPADGNVTFGVTGDRETAPDIGVLCTGDRARVRAA